MRCIVFVDVAPQYHALRTLRDDAKGRLLDPMDQFRGRSRAANDVEPGNAQLEAAVVRRVGLEQVGQSGHIRRCFHRSLQDSTPLSRLYTRNDFVQAPNGVQTGIGIVPHQLGRFFTLPRT